LELIDGEDLDLSATVIAVKNGERGTRKNSPYHGREPSNRTDYGKTIGIKLILAVR